MKRIFFFFFFLSVKTFSQSFYVDGANGNDANSGTSLTQAWQTIQNAFDNATPGSAVYIRGGTYNENVYANVSGTAGNPITFRNYQNEIVILDGTGTPQVDVLYIEDQSNLIIQNITIQNKVVNYATGIVITCTANSSASNITLRNLKITGINWTSNPSAIPSSNDNSNPLLVYGAGANQANAITNIIIDSCEVYNNITGFSEAIAVDGNVDGFTVSNNLVHDNKNIGIDMAGNYGASSNPLVDQARNGKCFSNICYNNVADYATSAGIYVDGGKDIIIERNTCYGNGSGIEIGCEENGSASNILVRDNAIYDNKEAGLAIGGYNAATTGQVLNSDVHHNTFLQNDYSNSGTGEIYMTKMSDCKIQDNVFYTNVQNILILKDNISPFSNNSINYNCWYTPNNNSNNITINWGTNAYSSFANYVSQTGMDANSVYADPLLANANISSPDFHVLPGSPCVDAGEPNYVITLNETDYFGNSRISGTEVDIGAHEFSSAGYIPENKTELSISVFPNPFSQYTTIQILNFGNHLDADLKVFNLTGKEVLAEIIRTSDSFIINRKKLADGVYFYQIIFEKEVIGRGKLLIQ